MSDGDRDEGPQGKAATQDVYARVASAAASRSGSGSGSAPSKNAGQGQNSGESSGQGGSAEAGGSGSPAGKGSGTAASTAPAKVASNPSPSKAASPSPAPASASAPSANGSAAAPATGGGAAKPAAKSWKDRLDSLTRLVMGTDESTGSTTGTTSDTPKKVAHAADDRSSQEPTAVVGVPVAAPAGRVTGARTAAPVAASPTAPSAETGDAETPDADKPKAGIPRRTRKARLRLSGLDPWSVMKTAFMFSIAGGIMLVVGVYAIWAVISGSGLFDNLNAIVAGVVSTPGDTTPFRVEDYVNTPKVMGVTAFLACIDVVIFTALATLGAFLYNLAATMLGGLEITLAED